MPIEIDRVEYLTAADIQQTLGIVRQTLWRWRKARKIPGGRRYRDRQIVFTRKEVDVIRAYANRLQPVETMTAKGHSKRGRLGAPNGRKRRRSRQKSK